MEPDVSNETGYSTGFVVCAHPFACEVKVRSEEKRRTILREFEVADAEVFGRFL